VWMGGVNDFLILRTDLTRLPAHSYSRFVQFISAGIVLYDDDRLKM
jgi:hypothetical protein